MKKLSSLIIWVVLLMTTSLVTLAQTPQLINYQAVARNESGQPLVDQSVSVRLSVHQSSAAGTVQYQETHNATTSAQGLINLQIGAGTVNIGTFAVITFTDGQPKFLQIELDPDGDGAQPFANMGTQQLVSVPYALYGEETRWVKVSGSNTKVGDSGYSLSGNFNTATGYDALSSNTTGYSNTANGIAALYSNTTGTSNTANGSYALFSNTTGSSNTANGDDALYSNTTGSDNTANGNDALYYNTTGNYNTANGVEALRSNTTGRNNTANGSKALFSNTTGYSNIAIGASALYRNTTKSNLVAVGDSALFNNGVGAAQSFEARYNTAIGSKALYSNTTGNDNTANGRHALRFNLTGSGNTANGYAALDANISGNYNTANGNFALYGNTTGHNNTCVGFSASPSSSSVSNYTGIGSLVGTGASASNMVEIGNSSVSVIRGQVGFTTYSDARIKENIQPDVPGLAFISQLKPVTYNLNVHRQNQMMYGTAKPDTIDWEGKYDIEKIRMTGFLAQDVEKAAQNAGFDFSGIVKPQNEHDLYSLRYAEFVVPLVKAVQEQQAIIETQNKTLAQLQQENQQMKAELTQIKAALGLK